MAKPGQDVYLVSRNMETATAADVDRAESRLGCSFPSGYREYVSTFGLGTYTGLIRIYMPDNILAELSEWRLRLQEYYFWDVGADALGKKEVLQCVVLGDTLNGDEFIFHPDRLEALYVLPRDDEQIYLAGATLDEAIDWLCISRTLLDEVLTFRYFECWKDREKLELFGRMGYREFKDSILNLDLHNHIVIDSEDEGCLKLFYSDFFGSLCHWCPDSVLIEYDRDKRNDVLATVTAHVLSLGFTDSSAG